jgi:hypothetical protein
MDQRQTALGAKASDHAHGIAIHRHGQGHFYLGPIHGGVGGGVDHQGGAMQIEQRLELVLQRWAGGFCGGAGAGGWGAGNCGQIELRPTHHQQRPLGQQGGGQPLHGTGHLAAAADQQHRLARASHLQFHDFSLHDFSLHDFSLHDFSFN